MDRKKRILSGGFAGRIKIKSAIVGLLLILAMIAGQMSLMATTSLAAYPSPGQNVTLYEDGEYNKYDALGNYIYCIEFDKHFSSTEPNVGDRLAAGETVAEINANPVKQTKTAMGPAWGPFSEEDRALIAVANLMLNREQMKHYCWEFLRGGKYNYGVGSHAFFQWPEFPPPDYSLDFVPQNTLLNRYYGKYQMLYTKSAYSGEPSVATRTIVDNNPATAGLDWQMIDAPAGVTFTHTGNQFKFDYANPTIQDFSVTLEVYFSRGPDLIYYWGTQADQICIIPGQELKKRVTIFFHVDPAEVVISKRADVPPGKVMKAGDEITYTIDVTNIGTGVMPNYGVEDPLPEYVEYVRSTGGNSRNYNSGTHTVRWELGDIQSKQTISLTVTVRVKEMGLDECARFIVNIAYGDDGASSNEVTHEQCASHLTLVKESDPPHGTVMKQGDTITYKLTVLNSGPQDTSGNTVRDNIPDGTTLVPGSARVVSGGTAVAQENPPLEVVFTNVTIPAGGRIVLEFKVTVNPLPKGMMARSLLNQAFLNDVPGNPTEHFVYSGTLNGVKTANPPSGSIVKVGSNITYTIAIYNNGPDKMHDITVTDQVPDGTTFISAAPSPDSTEPLATGQQKLIWRVPVLEGGEEKKFSFTVRVDELPDGVKFRTIENMATVDDRPTNSTVHYVGSAEIVGVKRSNPMTGTTVYENDVIRYTIDVKNTGSEPSDTVVITDSLPDNLVYVNMLSSGSTGQGGSVTGTRTASGTTKDGIQKYDFKWEISKLEPLESFSVWFEARVPKMPQGIDSREFRNVAFVNGNNTNETEHYQYAGSLRAVKSADPPDGSLVYEGTEITYTIKVYNDGADTLYNIPVTDQAPTGTTIIGTPTLSGTGAAGSGTAAGNVASWTITSLASGACATLQFRVRVGTMPENESSRTLRNTAQVGDFETNEVVHEQKNATLEISKTSSPTTGSIVYENDVITYSITVKNTGNDPSYNIKIKDKLPDNLNFVAGSMTNGSSPEGVSVTGAATNIGTTKDGVARYEFNWTVPKLEKGASVTVQFQGTVMKMPFGISERTFRNVGYVNNVPTNETEHSQYAGHLVAAKYSDPVAGTLVHEYDIITYTIEVINNGADTLYNIPAFDEIPAGTEYVPGSARLAVGTGPAGTAGTSFNSGLNRVEWVIPALESHQKAYLTFRVEVQRMPATETDRVIRNLATVDDFETNEVVHPQKNYTLAFSKTSDPITGTTVYEHDVITYSITVKNTGNDPVYDTVIKDKLPDNLQFVAGSVTTGTSPEGVALTGTATANGTTKDGIAKYDFQWTVPVLQRGQTVTVKFQGTVTKMPFGVSSREFRNVAYVNDIATNETEHYQYAGNLTAAKYADPVPGTLVHEYDIITYTIEVINNGADTLYNIPAFDDIPAGTAYVNGSVRMKIGTGSFVTTGCIYNSAEDRVEWVIPALQSAQKAVLEFKVEVQRMPETEADRTIYNIATVDDFETNEVVHPQKNYTLAFSKDSDPETGTIVYEHDIITYSVTVKNTGNDPAYNIVIKDKLPDNLAYIAGSITTGTSPEGIALTGTATANGATKDGITKYNFQWSIPKLEKGATVTVEFQAEVTKMPYGIDSREFRNVAYVNDRETNETEHYQHAGNLVAAKYADPIPGTLVHEHDIITYTVEVINNGADTLYDIPVFDEIPDNTVYQTGSVNMKIGTGAVVTAGCVYNSGLNRVEWVIPALKSHEKAVLTFQVEVGRLDKNEGTREIINVATVDDFQTNTVVHYQSNYDLQISKVSDPASGSTVYEKKPDGSGDTITYTVTVINTGNDPAYDVEITDKLPDNLKYVAGSITDGVTLAGGGTVTGTATVTGATRDGIDTYDFRWVVSKLMPEETVMVSFSADVQKMPYGFGSREFRNVALVNNIPTNETEHYQHAGDLVAAKYADPVPGTLVHEHDIITYTVEVINNGADTLYDIPVFDEIPDNTTYQTGSVNMKIGTGSVVTAGCTYNTGLNRVEWVIPALKSHEKAVLTFQVEVGRLDKNEGTRQIVNVATVDDFQTNTVVHHQSNYDLQISKESQPPTGSVVYEFDIITYTVTVINTGNDPAYDVKVTDKLPDNLKYVAGSVTNGTSPEGIAVTGTATVNGTTKDGIDGYDFAWVVPQMMPEEVITLSFQAEVQKMPYGFGSREFRNVAFVNNIPTNETEHYQHAGNLVAAKYADPIPGTLVHEYDIITYTIEVINNGADTLYDIPVFDEIPDNTTYQTGSAEMKIGTGAFVAAGCTFNSAQNRVEWVIPALRSSEKAVLHFRVEVGRLDKNEGTREIVNVATVDDFQTNKVVHYQSNYDLQISKVADPASGSTVYEKKPDGSGDTITYTVTVINTGNDPAYDVEITDKLPDNLKYVAGSITDGVTLAGGGTVTGTATKTGATRDGIDKYDFRWVVSKLMPEETVTVSFSADVVPMPYGVHEREFRNVALVNNIPTNETEHYQYSSNLAAIKYSDPTENTLLHEGDIVTYYIDVINNGADTAYDIPVSDAIPVGTVYVPGSAAMKIGSGTSAASGALNGNKLEWTIPALASRETATLSFQVEVQRMPTNQDTRKIDNVATVDDFETNHVVHTQSNFTLHGVKKSDPMTGTTVYERKPDGRGDIITYIVEVTNEGLDPAYDVEITDQLPDNLDYVTGSITTGTALPGGGTIAGTATKLAQPTESGVDRYEFKWIVSKLMPGEVAHVEFKGTVMTMPQGIAMREFRNVAYVNNHATNETVHYQYAPHLRAVKHSDPVPNSYVRVDDVITYFIDVYNDGADTEYNIDVLDSIPAGTELVPGSITLTNDGTAVIGAGSQSGNQVHWVIDSLAAGRKAVLTFQTKVLAMPKNLDERTIDNVAKVNDFETNHVTHLQTNYAVYGQKSSDKPTGSRVHVGEIITYTIEIMNKGADAARNVKVRDMIPLGTTYVANSASTSANVSSTKTLNAENELEWTIVLLAPNGVEKVTFQVMVDELPEGDTFGVVDNFGYVDEKVTNTVTHEVRKDLLLFEKTASPVDGSEVMERQRITYKIALKNIGDMKARNVVVTDQIPAGTKLIPGSISHGGTESGGVITWNLSTWSVGEERTLTFAVEVLPLAEGESEFVIENRATVKNGVNDPGDDTNTVRHIVRKPVLEFFKDANPPSGSRVKAGDIITYTIVVRNKGTLADHNVHIEDLIPEGTTYVKDSLTSTGGGTGGYLTAPNRVVWTIPELAPAGNHGSAGSYGGEVFLTFKVKVNPLPTGVDEGLVKNKATIWGYDVDGEDTNETEHIVSRSRLSITKEADPPDNSVVQPGEVITYTLKVTNDSADALEYVPVWDTIPAGTTYVRASATAGGRLVRDPSGVAINRVEWVIGTIAPGQTIELKFKVRVDALPEGQHTRKIFNAALVGEGGTEEDPGIPKVPSNEVEHDVIDGPIKISKSSDPAPGSYVYTGQTITYTLTLRNASDAPIVNVPVRDFVPEGTTFVTGSMTGGVKQDYTVLTRQLDWLIAVIPAGGSVDVTFKVIANELPFGKAIGYITNQGFCGQGGGTEDEPGTPDTPSNEVTHIITWHPIEGRKESDPPTGSTVEAGATIEYTVYAVNNSGAAAENVAVIDPIPLGTYYKSGSADSGGTYDAVNNWVRWTIPHMEDGETVAVKFSVIVGQMGVGETGKVIYNQAIVNGSSTNTVTHNVVKPELYGVKSSSPASGSVVYGDQRVDYTVTVHNNSAVTKTNVIVRDTVPLYTNYITGTMTNNAALGIVGTYSAGSRELAWTIASIPAGGSVTLQFTVTVDSLPAGVITRVINNVAYVNGLATNQVTHHLYQPIPIGVKEANPPTGTQVKAGDEIEYTLRVYNYDRLDAHNVVVRDAIPTGTDFITGSETTPAGATFTYDATKREVRWVIASLPKEGTQGYTFTFKVRVQELPENLGQRVIRNIGYVNDTPTNETNHYQQKPPVQAYKYSDPPSGSRVPVGSKITYSIRVTNPGTQPLANVHVMDYIPAGTKYITGSVSNQSDYAGAYSAASDSVSWLIPTLQPGTAGQVTLTFEVEVQHLPQGMELCRIINLALVNGNPTNQTTHVVAAPKIEAEKIANPPHLSEVLEGQVIRYTITVRNVGEVPDYNIKVLDQIPQFTTLLPETITNGGRLVGGNTIEWTIAELLNGAERHLSFDVVADALPEGVERRRIENTAVFGQGGEDPENPTNTVEHNVNKANVVAVKSANPAAGTTVGVGDIIQYTISLKNEGALNAPNTEVYDEIPAGTTFVSNSIRGNGYYNAALNRVEWSVTNIQAGSTAYVGFSVRVNALPEGATEGTVRNAAVVDGEETPPVEHPVALSNVTVVKTANPPSGTEVMVGDTITYTITVANHSQATLYNIPVQDTLPSGTTFVADSANNGGIYYPPNRRVAWLIPTLGAGESIALTFSVTVDELPPQTEMLLILNKAYFHPGSPEPSIPPQIPDKPTNETEHPAYPKTFSAEKTSIPASGSDVNPGDVIDYTVTVRNFNATAMANVAVTDILDADLEFISAGEGGTYDPITRVISWTIPSIPALHGAMAVTFRARVTANPAKSVIHNQARANDKPTNTTVHYPGDVPPINDPRVLLAKSADPAHNSWVAQGETITYYIDVRNVGQQPALNVVVRDAIPAGTVYVPGSVSHGGSLNASNQLVWNLGTLPANSATTRLSFRVTVDYIAHPEDTPYYYHTLRNTAYVDYNSTDGRHFDGRSEEVIHNVDGGEPRPYFYAVKSADPADGSYLSPNGQRVRYTITVYNMTGAAISGLRVYDLIPGGTTYVPGSAGSTSLSASVTEGYAGGRVSDLTWNAAYIAAGSFEQFYFSVDVPALPEGAGYRSVRNSALVTGGDRVTSTNQVIHYQSRGPIPPDVPVKTAVPPSGTTVRPGDEITYTVTARNGATAPATIIIRDAIPAGTEYVTGSATNGAAYAGNVLTWTFANVPAGASVTATFRVKVLEYEASPWIVNVAQVNVGGNSYTTDQVVHYNPPVPDPDDDIRLDKVANPVSGSAVTPGQEITYTINVVNTSARRIENITVTDPVPVGTVYIPGSADNAGSFAGNSLTWAIAALEAGETKTLTFKARVMDYPTYLIRNVAYANYENRNVGSNETVHYPGPPQFRVEKNANPVTGSIVQPGQEIYYTVTVTNLGSQMLRPVQITDNIPAGTTYVPNSASIAVLDGTPNAMAGVLSGNTLYWNLAGLAPGMSAMAVFKVTVDALPAGISGRLVRNSANVTGNGRTLITNEVVHYVGRIVEMDLRKDSDPAPNSIVTYGQEITYTLTLTNYAQTAQTDITVSDTIPAGTQYVSGGTLSGNAVVFQVARIEPSESKTFTFTVRVLDTAVFGQLIRNTARAIWGDKQIDSNEVDHTVNPNRPNVQASKRSTPASGTAVVAGQTIRYTIELRNLGGSAANGVTVRDSIPAGTTFAGAASDGGQYNAVNNELRWSVASIPAGGTVELWFEVTVNARASASMYVIRNTAYYVPTPGSPEQPTNEVTNVINPSDGLRLQKRSDPAPGSIVNTGSTITYYLDVINGGDVDETDVRVSDAIPAGLQYVAGSANYGGTLAGGTVHWLLERVAANSTVTLRFQATVLPPAAGSPAVRYFRNIGMVNGQPSNPVDHVDIVEVQYPSAVGSKRADPAAGSTVQPGRTVTYYIDVINNGNVNLTNIPVRDTIPAGTTYVAGSATSGGTLSGNELRWTIPALNVGQVFTVAFQVTVNQLQPGENSRTIRNIAIISGPQGETPTPEVPHIVFPDQPGLRLVKTSSKQGEVKAGEELTYTLTVTNSGAIQQTAIRVTDSIPAGTEYVAGSATDGGTLADGVITWTIAQLAPGGSKSVSFKVTVLPLPENTLYRIIRNVGYLNNEPGDPVENPQVPELPVTGVKRADPPAGTPLTAGRLVTYYIDVTNHNAKTASNVVVRDTVPTGTSLVAGSVSGSGAVTGNEIVWTIPSLAGGQTVTVYFTVTVDPLPAGVSYRIIRNQAIVAAPDPDHPENPPVETPTPPVEHPQVPPMPGLYLYKVSNRPANSPVQAGDEITYSLTATNYGTAEQTNVIITDAIPAGTTYVEGSASEGAVRSGNVLTWVIASLPAGASRMVSFRVTVDPLPEGSSGRVIRNIGYINGQPGDPVEHPEVPSQGGVYGSKRANPPAGTVLRAGDVVTYSIDVTNYYGKTASNVTVRDSIPAGVTLIPSSITMGGVYADGQIVWSIPAIAAGQTVTVSFQAVVNPLLAGVSYQIIRNQAIVAAPDPDHPEQPPIEVPTPPVEHPQIPPVSGLWVQKTSSRPSYGAVRPGDELTYYLTVTNYGSEIRTNVQVVDSIPQGTTYVAGSASDSAALNGGALIWVIASLAPGASKTVSFRVRVNELPSGQSAGVIRNVGYVNGTPSNPEENPVIPNPPVYEGVTGNKRANPAAGSVLHAGDVVTYSIDVTNHYSKTVANVAVRDSIPAGTTLVPSSITAGGVYSGGQIVWSIPSLAPGQTVTVSFSVTVNALPAGVSFATIRNQAIVAAPNPDRPDLPPVETPTPPVEHPQLPPSGGLYLHKSSNTYGSVQPGQEITYTITLVNYGGTVRENIVVTDSIPQGTAYVAGSASDGGTLNGNVLSWTVASLAPGQSKTLTFRVTVNADATGSIRNTAYVDGNPSNPDEVPVIPVIPQPGTPDVVGTKRSDPASGSSVQAGQAITYYIHVTNRSNRAASNVTVRDAIPAGTTLIAGSIDNGGTEAGGTVTWSIPSLGAGATMVLSFRVTVNALAAGTSYAVIRNRAIITGPSNGGSGPVVDSPTNDVTHDNTPPRLDVVKSADRNVSKKDDVITYTIRVYNRGSSAVSNVIIRDQIPAGTRYVNNSANPAAALSGDVLTWNVASIPAGGSATVSFQVKVTTDAAGTIANTANAGVDGDGDGIPDDGGDDSNTVIVDNNNNGGNGGCNCGNGGGNGGCNCGNGHGNGNGNGDGDGQSGGNNGNININIDNTNNNNNSNGGIVNNVTNGNGNGGSSGTTGNGNSGAGNGSSNGSGNTGNGIGNSNGSGNGVGKVPNTNEASAMWAILVMACSAAMIALVLAFRKSVAKRQRKLR